MVSLSGVLRCRLRTFYFSVRPLNDIEKWHYGLSSIRKTGQAMETAKLKLCKKSSTRRWKVERPLCLNVRVVKRRITSDNSLKTAWSTCLSIFGGSKIPFSKQIFIKPNWPKWRKTRKNHLNFYRTKKRTLILLIPIAINTFKTLRNSISVDGM
jgi:hypothetical protein